MAFHSEKITHYIRTNIETVTALEVAGNFGYSHYHFSRLFKKHMGVTLREYISAIKIERGISVLEDGGSVTDAQLGSGYESSGSYTNIFKSQTGLTPSGHQSSLMSFIRGLSSSLHLNARTPAHYLYAPFIQSKHRQKYALTIDIENRSAPNSLLFIGLFPKALSVGIPALGICLARGNRYQVMSIPSGRYYVLVCEIRRQRNVIKMLSLKGCLRDLCRTPVDFPLASPQQVTLTLREEQASDPPINVHPLNLMFEALKKPKAEKRD